ncbi:MAG: hypothetical protein Ct9H300mP11_14780 [Chloroflexota bacterium]|nr:MAG: hypothetical protein Ct9H300mP11_14780 [Chloroflexota bacterium]
MQPQEERGALSDALLMHSGQKDLPTLSSTESAVINYGRNSSELAGLSSNVDAALDKFGDRGLIELTNLMGYYSVLAFNINAFEQLPRLRTNLFSPFRSAFLTMLA